MADDILKSRGRTKGYKLDRGGMPADTGPFIAEIMNNVDPTRNGRIQVYIEEFAKGDKNDPSGWRTVSYLTPYYGKVEHNGTTEGVGTSVGNAQSYGMWFTTPDIGVKVMCFFVNGDPGYGYYTGCVPESGLTHMIPAIADNVTEINHKDKAISEDPRFYEKPKPKHTSVTATMYQQGLDKDTVRGVINSTVQRESPSNVYGISTPGRPVYANGMYDTNIKETLAGELEPQDIKIVGRRGGHSLVMDDGDLEGKNQLVRIRSATGHQITMSDDGECFYITHANGQSWLEFGKSGTIDLYSSNSVNVRTQGTINLHADEDININAGKNFNVYTGENINIESKMKTSLLSATGTDVKSIGNVNLESSAGVSIGGSRIDLNKSGASTVTTSITPMIPTEYTDIELKETGWIPEKTPTLKSITSRAPTHEPYGLHNEPAPDLTSPIDRSKLNTQVIDLINNLKVEPPKYS